MNHLKKWLCVLMAVLMAFTACSSLAEFGGTALQPQLTAGNLEALGAKAYTSDGRVTFVDGACTADPIKDREDAARTAESMITRIGGDARTRFEPWRTLTDAKGNRYYVFQQVYAGVTVPGGAVKIITDPQGRMLGMVASVESDLPDASEAEGISAQQAEALVMERLQSTPGQAQAELIEGYTERTILPVKMGIDPDSEDEVEDAKCRYVWAVYTSNIGEKDMDRPYLAHYVAMDGTWLYSLPTVLPGDEAGTSGFSAAYVFENMEPVEYTGKVSLSDGSEQEITVTLMKNAQTGKFYLADPVRRIAVADCWEFVFGDGGIVLEESDSNTGWDNACLLALYNYSRVWDYYNAIGWAGGDGLGTPILILKDYCNRDHEPIDNAAYAGKYYGWQVFLTSGANDLAQCLDVLAHEFTHCVTGSVMTFSAYMNDTGAINEAMSDIQGNFCEMMLGATEDTAGLLGENSKNPAIRSMSQPHDFQQPEYVWDLYYTPKVKTPTEVNDRGGVHTNSSLLNNLAWRLYEKGGMTLEDARAFWFAVDCSMVPGTDYVQLSLLLPWVLKNQGMEQYANAMEAALDATRLRTNTMPETLDNDRTLVTLTLPDDERFTDGNWVLMMLSVNTEAIAERVKGIRSRTGEYAAFSDELAALAGVDPALLPTAQEVAENPDHAWDRLADAIGNWTDEQLDKALDGMLSEKMPELVRKYFGDVFYAGNVAAGQDGRTIRMVCRPGTALPVLFRLDLDNDLHVRSAGLAVYLFGSWLDAGSFLAPVITLFSEAEPAADGEEQESPLSWLDGLFGTEESSEPGENGQEEPDLSWLDLLFPTDSGAASGEEPQEEQKPSWLQSLLDSKFVSMLKKARQAAVSLAWTLVKEFVFWKITPGEVNVLPAGGLENVTTLDAEAYPFLKTLLTMDSAEESSGNSESSQL